MLQTQTGRSAASNTPGDGASGSAVDVVLAQHRRLIVEGGLKLGDRLPTERELCERFTSSRNTVREAVMQVNENQSAMGRTWAEFVLKELAARGKTSGKLLEVRGLPGNSVDRDRSTGIHEVLDASGAASGR